MLAASLRAYTSASLVPLIAVPLFSATDFPTAGPLSEGAPPGAYNSTSNRARRRSVPTARMLGLSVISVATFVT
jgi:hypothetical protein